MNPFEYLKAINETKKDIMVDDIAEKDYNPFIINRGLSFFKDTILYANEMNVHHHLDNRVQFDFFINIIRKKKRWSKWTKPSDVDNLELIKEYYGYSNEKTRSALSLLSAEQINIIKQKVDHGGRKGKRAS